MPLKDIAFKEIFASIEHCDECGWDAPFCERQFPMIFHRCQMCGRNLCSNCWGHKHLLAWKYCNNCKPNYEDEL